MAQDEQPATSAAQNKPEAASSPCRAYQAGGGRKLLFSFVFLLLLPFFASLPAMLYHRLAAGLWYDTVGLMIFAAAFAIIMLLVIFELIYSLRARIEIGDTAVRFTLPTGRGGAMPKLFYRTCEIPYSDVAAVETRREIYGGSTAPVLLRGARITTRSGDKIPLCYVSEADTDALFPIQEIASEIGKRAGVEVSDRGNVRRDIRKKWFGVKAEDKADSAIPETAIAALNQRHKRVVLMICSGLFVLVAAGIVQDLFKADLDLGERSDVSTQKSAKPSPQAQKVRTGQK